MINLVLLCDEHHHQVHEGGWTLTMRDGIVTMTSPDGRKAYIEAPPISGNGDQLISAVPATITAGTLTGGQTGDRLNLSFATDVLAPYLQPEEPDSPTDTET